MDVIKPGVTLRRVPSKEQLVAEYRFWCNGGRTQTATPRILSGLFYSRYKERYRLYPPSDVKTDLLNMECFLTTFVKEDPELAPWVVDLFFTFKSFNNLTTATFCNRNVLNGWGAFERAQKMRCHFGVGEQSEFQSDFKGVGNMRV